MRPNEHPLTPTITKSDEGYAAIFLAVLQTDSTTVQTGNKLRHLVETAAWNWVDQAAIKTKIRTVHH